MALQKRYCGFECQLSASHFRYVGNMRVFTVVDQIERKNKVLLHNCTREDSYLIQSIMNMKKNWIGHVVRSEGLLKVVLEGRIRDKTPRCWPRIGRKSLFVLFSYMGILGINHMLSVLLKAKIESLKRFYFYDFLSITFQHSVFGE